MSGVLRTSIVFVCVRPEHHRRRAIGAALSENLGRSAYCPAGDLEGHDWLPGPTDRARLACLGMCPPHSDDPQPPERSSSAGNLVLIAR